MSETSLDPGGDGGERRAGFRAVGASLLRIVGPIVARHGGGIVTRLKSEWAAIVGPELAVATWPESLARGGTLKLRVAPGKALELQHRAPLVIERVNLFFGREAVARLVLVQAPLPLAAPAPRVLEPFVGPGEAAMLEEQLTVIANGELRAALVQLGRRVIGASRDDSGR
jgi:hypothetical protein